MANDKPLTRNEDGWYTLSVEYGQPVTLEVSAQGPAETKYLTWYPVMLNANGEPEMTGSPLDNNDLTTLTLPDLTIGKHAYAVIVSDGRRQQCRRRSCRIPGVLAYLYHRRKNRHCEGSRKSD